MAMLRKNDPLYFLDIGRVYPRVKCQSYPLHLTKCCLIPFLLRVRTILSISNYVWGETVTLTSS